MALKGFKGFVRNAINRQPRSLMGCASLAKDGVRRPNPETSYCKIDVEIVLTECACAIDCLSIKFYHIKQGVRT